MNIKLGKYKVCFDFRLDKFPALNLRPFFAGFIAVFLFTLFSHFVKLPDFQLKKDINLYHWVNNNSNLKQLEKTPNDYKLIKTTPIVSSAWAAGEFKNASSYIVTDFKSGNVILEKKSDRKLPIASLTKIMTAVVAVDLASPSDLFEISRRASMETPTTIGVVPGEKMALKELLNGLLLTSGNDAAEVIKEGIDKKYGRGFFVKAMNEKAKFLNLKQTHFDNPQGFDSRSNYSSSEDLAVLSHYALANYTLISEITKKDYQYLPPNENHNKLFDLYNWNGLLGVYPGILGLKIGNTDNAGHTTVVVSERNGKTLTVVLLGATGIIERDLWTSELLDAGFEKFGISAANVTVDQLQEKYGTWKYYN